MTYPFHAAEDGAHRASRIQAGAQLDRCPEPELAPHSIRRIKRHLELNRPTKRSLRDDDLTSLDIFTAIRWSNFDGAVIRRRWGELGWHNSEQL